jgi:hypothetical protein
MTKGCSLTVVLKMTTKTSLAFECILSLILVLSLCAFGQPTEVWSRNYGGQSSDPGGAVKVTYDGGYVLTGTTYSYGLGRGDLWLVKTDSNGTEQWNKTFGGRNFDIGRSVQQTSDGGYIIAGSTQSFGVRNSDAWLIKTDKNGTEQWNRTFGGRGTDEATSVQQTDDGGYIFTGFTSSYGIGGDVWLIRTNSSGHELWNKTFGKDGSDHGWSVIQAADGGFVIAGDLDNYVPSNDNADLSSNTGSNTDAWLIKTYKNGTEQWNTVIKSSMDDSAKSVQQTRDGGFVLTGYTKANLYQDNAVSEVLLSKVAGNGTEEWRKIFEGKSSSGTNEGQAVLQTIDGGYIVAGDTTTYGDSNGDALVIKTDPKGNAQWIRPFGGQGSQSADSVQEAKSGGYVIAGNTNRPGGYDIDIWLMKLK